MVKKLNFVLIFILSVCFFSFVVSKKEPSNETNLALISTKTKEIKTFLKKNVAYNNQIVFLLDMKIASNKFRFFVVDLETEKVINSGLVAHGSGSDNGDGKLVFGNKDGSLKTSLGKYAIDLKSYEGTFGKSYRMVGLDKINSNAYMRNIVLHAYPKVPETEVENPIVLSWGCPMVNETFFLKLQEILDKTDKKVLMYIYY